VFNAEMPFPGGLFIDLEAAGQRSIERA